MTLALLQSGHETRGKPVSSPMAESGLGWADLPAEDAMERDIGGGRVADVGRVRFILCN